MFVKRLGSQPKNSNVPRRLLVVLDSEQLAAEMLFRARQLRNSTDFSIAENMFFNKDLSPEDERAAYERRQARRAAISKPS